MVRVRVVVGAPRCAGGATSVRGTFMLHHRFMLHTIRSTRLLVVSIVVLVGLRFIMSIDCRVTSG
jgi:hypothetical protein